LSGLIRGYSDNPREVQEIGKCPIGAVHMLKFNNELYRSQDWREHAKEIGLDYNDAKSVVVASDGERTDLRERILETLDLKDKESYSDLRDIRTRF
jgi:hypothetical protein